MQLSTYIIVAAIEVYILLLVISILLIIYLRKQRQLIRRQQEKLQQVIAELKKLKLPPATVEVTGSTYKTHIHAQITATRNHYAGLSPPGDISGQQAPDSTASHKALALRYQFLQIEESAIAKGDGPLKINWQAFENLLHEFIVNNQSDLNAEELANYKKRVENLEKFKKLFFDMEQQWQNAKTQAQDYHQQLLAMAGGVDDKGHFTDLLDSYYRVYNDIDEGFEHGNQVLGSTSTAADPQVITVTRIDPRAGNEIIKLRNVAADQHRIISQLQRKLEEAVTAEAKEIVINELQQQLQRQVRFVQESETCIKLLEDELASASEKLNKQQQYLDAASGTQEENNRIKETLQSFIQESKELIANITKLEQENEQLKANLHKRQPDVTDGATPENSAALKAVQSELLSLQGQYAELEEKYLDLRLK